MTIAQGLSKITVYKKQSGLGVPASGSGGQIVRRATSGNELNIATFSNSELSSSQQDVGMGRGLRSVAQALSGTLSPKTYAAIIGSVLRKDFAATTAITGASLTIAGTNPYTLTRAAGSWLTDGIKIGDVIRLSVGALNAANLSKNLVVTAIGSATALTFKPLNGVACVAEGPVTGCTVSVPGKKSWVPTTGHTYDYYSLEDWTSTITDSQLFTDVMFGKVDVTNPASGFATINIGGAGLNRTDGTAQVLTTPTAENTDAGLTSSVGMLLINGASVPNVTGFTLNIDGKVTDMGSVAFSNLSPDIKRGALTVSGSLDAYKMDGSLATLYNAGTEFSLIAVIADTAAADSAFVSFIMSSSFFSKESKDDGDKGIVQKMTFYSRKNPSGGAALANLETIVSVQDSAA